MSKVEEIEGQVVLLSARELTEFREWFTRFDAEVSDRQFEADATSDQLDRLAEQA